MNFPLVISHFPFFSFYSSQSSCFASKKWPVQLPKPWSCLVELPGFPYCLSVFQNFPVQRYHRPIPYSSLVEIFYHVSPFFFPFKKILSILNFCFPRSTKLLPLLFHFQNCFHALFSSHIIPCNPFVFEFFIIVFQYLLCHTNSLLFFPGSKNTFQF